MMEPEIFYAQSPDGSGEVACAVSFVPTFDDIAAPGEFNVIVDEKPEQENLYAGSEFHFIFLVDRSGSMHSYNRMQIAKDSLSLFIRSLPEGCTFSVISFGSNCESDEFENLIYGDETKNAAL